MFTSLSQHILRPGPCVLGRLHWDRTTQATGTEDTAAAPESHLATRFPFGRYDRVC